MNDILNRGQSKVRQEPLLQLCKNAIDGIAPGVTIILYGSRARNEAKSESDYDFLVLVAGEISEELENKIGDAIYELELEWGVVISSILFSLKEWESPLYNEMPLVKNIKREGIVL